MRLGAGLALLTVAAGTTGATPALALGTPPARPALVSYEFGKKYLDAANTTNPAVIMSCNVAAPNQTTYAFGMGDLRSPDGQVLSLGLAQIVANWDESLGIHLANLDLQQSIFTNEAVLPGLEGQSIISEFGYSGVVPVGSYFTVALAIWGDPSTSCSATFNGTPITLSAGDSSNALAVTAGDFAGNLALSGPVSLDQGLTYNRLSRGHLFAFFAPSIPTPVAPVGSFGVQGPEGFSDCVGRAECPLSGNAIVVDKVTNGSWTYTIDDAVDFEPAGIPGPTPVLWILELPA